MAEHNFFNFMVLGTQRSAGYRMYPAAEVGPRAKDSLPHISSSLVPRTSTGLFPFQLRRAPRTGDTQESDQDSEGTFPTCPPPAELQLNEDGTTPGSPLKRHLVLCPPRSTGLHIPFEDQKGVHHKLQWTRKIKKVFNTKKFLQT